MTYLESSPHAEDSVVRFFGGESFDGQLNNLVLFRDQIVGSIVFKASALPIEIDFEYPEEQLSRICARTYLSPSCL